MLSLSRFSSFVLVLSSFLMVLWATNNATAQDFDETEKVSLAQLKKATVRLVIAPRRDAPPQVSQTAVFLKDDDGNVHLITAAHGFLMLAHRPEPVEKLTLSVYDASGKLVELDAHVGIRGWDLKHDLVSIDISDWKYKGSAVPFYSNFMPDAGYRAHFRVLGYGDGKADLRADYRFSHQKNARLEDCIQSNQQEANFFPVIPDQKSEVLFGVVNHNLFGVSGGPVVREKPESGKPFGLVIGGQETGTWIAPIDLDEFVADSALNDEQLHLLQQQIDKFQQYGLEDHTQYCFKTINYVQPNFARKGVPVNPDQPFEVIISAFAAAHGDEVDAAKYIYTAANLVNVEQDTYYGKDNRSVIKKETKNQKYGNDYLTASFNLIMGRYHLMEYRRQTIVGKRATKLRGDLKIVKEYYRTLRGIYHEHETVFLEPVERRLLKKYDLDMMAEFEDYFAAVKNEVDAATAFAKGEEAEIAGNMARARELFAITLDYQSAYEWKAQQKLRAIDAKVNDYVKAGYLALKGQEFGKAYQQLELAQAIRPIDSIAETLMDLDQKHDWLIRRGDANEAGGNQDSAAWYYQQAQRMKPNEYTTAQLALLSQHDSVPKVERLKALTIQLYESGNYEAALRRAGQVLKLAPNENYFREIEAESRQNVEERAQDEALVKLADAITDDLTRRIELRSGLESFPNLQFKTMHGDSGLILDLEYGMDWLELPIGPKQVRNYDNLPPGEISTQGIDQMLALYADVLDEQLKAASSHVNRSDIELKIYSLVDAIKFQNDLDFDAKAQPELLMDSVVTMENVDSTITFAEAIPKLNANRGLAYLRGLHAQAAMKPVMGALQSDIPIEVYHDRKNFGGEARKVVIRLEVKAKN